MQSDDHPRLGHSSSVSSRAQNVVLKTAAVIAGAVTVVAAFALSIAFVAVGLAAVLVVGGYLWWKTRHVRRELSARMQARTPAKEAQGDVIEGVVLSRKETDESGRQNR